MSDDKLEFLDETQAQAAEVEVTEAPEPEAAEAPEEQASTGEEQAAPPAAEEETAKSIPISALLDERDKRQKAERDLEAMRRWRDEQARRMQPREDINKNPHAVINREVTNVKLEQSRFLATRDFGEDVVREAFEFFNQPEYAAKSHEFLAHPSPFHAAVEFVKREKFMQEVQDPDKWREAERERIRQEILAETQNPKAPPPSIANAPNAGGQTPAPGNAFDAMFEG